MHPQRAAAAAFFVLSTTYLVLAFGIEEVATVSASAMGPRGFPLLVGALGALISLLLLVAPNRAPIDTPHTLDPQGSALAAGTRAGHDAEVEPARGVFTGDWKRALTLCFLTLLYAVALPILGFTLATTGFLAASFRLLGERRAAVLVVVPFATAVVSLALLRGALGAHLPEPLFEDVLWWIVRWIEQVRV